MNTAKIIEMTVTISDESVISVSDIIQIVSIVIALIVGIASIIISVVALRQNSKIIKESNKAQIEVFPLKLYGDSVPRIKIQNFGNSTGMITSVKTIPEMPKGDIIINPFKFYEGLSLAPNQSFTTVFCKNDMYNAPVEQFDVLLTYETLGDEVKSTYHINYKFLEGAVEVSSAPKDTTKALNNINQSIQGLLQK